MVEALYSGPCVLNNNMTASLPMVIRLMKQSRTFAQTVAKPAQYSLRRKFCSLRPPHAVKLPAVGTSVNQAVCAATKTVAHIRTQSALLIARMGLPQVKKRCAEALSSAEQAPEAPEEGPADIDHSIRWTSSKPDATWCKDPESSHAAYHAHCRLPQRVHGTDGYRLPPRRFDHPFRSEVEPETISIWSAAEIRQQKDDFTRLFIAPRAEYMQIPFSTDGVWHEADGSTSTGRVAPIQERNLRQSEVPTFRAAMKRARAPASSITVRKVGRFVDNLMEEALELQQYETLVLEEVAQCKAILDNPHTSAEEREMFSSTMDELILTLSDISRHNFSHTCHQVDTLLGVARPESSKPELACATIARPSHAAADPVTSTRHSMVVALTRKNTDALKRAGKSSKRRRPRWQRKPR